MTPFEAVYGVPPPSLLIYVRGTLKVQVVDGYLHDRDAILHELRKNFSLAQERMKCQADQRCLEVIFEVGDFVYLKLQPYWQTSVAFRSSLKLSLRYFGLYKITEKVGPVAYRLALPLSFLIHNIFHVSMLRKHVGPVTTISTQLPPMTDVEGLVRECVYAEGHYMWVCACRRTCTRGVWGMSLCWLLTVAGN